MAKTFRELLQQIDALSANTWQSGKCLFNLIPRLANLLVRTLKINLLMNAREMTEKIDVGVRGLQGRFSSESAKPAEIALKCAISAQLFCSQMWYDTKRLIHDGHALHGYTTDRRENRRQTGRVK